MLNFKDWKNPDEIKHPRQTQVKASCFLGIWFAEGEIHVPAWKHPDGRTPQWYMQRYSVRLGLSSGSVIGGVRRSLAKKVGRNQVRLEKQIKRKKHKLEQRTRKETFDLTVKSS